MSFGSPKLGFEKPTLGAQKFAIRDTSNVFGQNHNSSTSVSVHKYPFAKTPRNEETTFTYFA